MIVMCYSGGLWPSSPVAFLPMLTGGLGERIRAFEGPFGETGCPLV